MPEIPTQFAEDKLSRQVTLFYARVRQDADLGPIFNQAVSDWPAHLSKLTDFWHAVMLTSGRYKGDPMTAHMRHTAIRPEHFDRWLMLWRQASEEVMSPEDASALIAKAERIGESLKLALFYRMPAARAAIR